MILVNVAGITLFARFDLTRDGIFSLSGASQRAVSTLSEPLTLHVFFSRNLPPPYNSIEQYLRDLLEEYALRANRWLSYRFYDVSAEQSDGAADSGENQNRCMRGASGAGSVHGGGGHRNVPAAESNAAPELADVNFF